MAAAARSLKRIKYLHVILMQCRLLKKGFILIVLYYIIFPISNQTCLLIFDIKGKTAPFFARGNPLTVDAH